MAGVSLLTEIRGTVRGLVRTPTVAISAVLCIALGLGATAAIFSAIDRALLQRLPFHDPERLVTVFRTTPHFDTGPFAAPNYTDLARESSLIDELAAIAQSGALLSLRDEAVQAEVKRVTGNLFPMLGVSALRGRMLVPRDDALDQPPVVVMSEELWRERFGADPAVVGSTIRLDGEPHTVVGIAPRRLTVPHGPFVVRSELWVPMRFSAEELGRRRSNYLLVMGRLARGASVETAQAELVRIFSGLVEAYPQLRGEGVRVRPLQAEAQREVRTPLLLMLGAVVMVLLIAATNVASLLLARGVQRRRENAVRTALGGSRAQVMRPVLIESLVLTAVGLALGLVLAVAGVRTIGVLAARRLPQLDGLAVDLRIVALAVVLSVVVAVLCGALPAWRSASVDPQEALRGGRGGGASRTHHRSLSALVVAEVALSLVLLIGAGLTLKGFARLLREDPGFDPQRILTLAATVSPGGYPEGSAVRRFLEPALERIRQVPGVEAAAFITVMPYRNWGWNFNVRYEGQPGDDPTQRPLVENRVITPEFFRVTGQRLIAGRLLTDADDERPEALAAVVVNEALMHRDFDGEPPLGKRFHTSDTTFATIVGVVSDIRNFGPYDEPRPEVYRPARRDASGQTSFPLVVRVKSGDPAAVAGAVRSAIRAVDPGAAVTDVQPMEEVIADSVGEPRFYLTLLGVFALVAVVLAVSGMYGVLSYAVAQRMREFGIRTALGSTAAQIAGLVTRRGMTLIAIGVVVGIAGGAAVTRLMGSLLYGVSPLDAVTWALAIVALVAVGLLASLLPAWRATRADPLVAMRVE
ncbi:MAG TPA: ABC transporter permease [Gemmatimonadaceae bacterium]|nr:ABC transporter permease [Gemmatimonadaceae bacterium]